MPMGWEGEGLNDQLRNEDTQSTGSISLVGIAFRLIAQQGDLYHA
jgi:hypothetical protein